MFHPAGGTEIKGTAIGRKRRKCGKTETVGRKGRLKGTMMVDIVDEDTVATVEDFDAVLAAHVEPLVGIVGGEGLHIGVVAYNGRLFTV